MVEAAKVFETVEKKKKQNISKNRKKSWRKHIDLSSVECALDEQARDDRLGYLGEKPAEELFELDLYDNDDETKDDKETEEHDKKIAELAIRNLSYIVDPNTGLKATNRKKSNKILAEQRYLAGLPGAATHYKGVSRTRKQDDDQWRISMREKRLEKPHYASRAELKKKKTFLSAKKSKKEKKESKKLNFDSNLWSEPEPTTIEEDIAKPALDHTKLVMKTKPINNRVSKVQPKKMPGVMIPHPGLSYHPDLESHQSLQRAALKFEMKRTSKAKKEKVAKNEKFPEGAVKVDADELICDMNAEGQKFNSNKSATSKRKGKKRKLTTEHDSVKVRAKRKTVTKNGVPTEKEDTINGSEPQAESITEEQPPTVLKKPQERKTHQQRLRQIRNNALLRKREEEKLRKKNQNEINKIKTISKEIAQTESRLAQRAKKRQKKLMESAYKPPKMFVEKTYEVSLRSELHGNVRNVVPTSNVMSDIITHIRRRGLLPCHRMNRNYSTTKVKSLTKKTKPRAVDAFTEEDFEGLQEESTKPGKK